MEHTGPSAIIVTAIQILIAVAAIAFAIWRGEQARRQHAEALTRARTRRVYFCFLAWGAFVLLAAVVAIVSEPYLEVVGILGGIPVGIVAVIGLFHMLMVWRVRLVQVLLLATVLVGALVAAPVPDIWFAVIAGVYGLGVMVISVGALRGLSRGAAV